MVWPKMVTLLKGPNERVAKTPKILIDTDAIIVALALDIFNSSFKYATTTSKTEIVDVNAATASKKKNITENIKPPGIDLNTLGITSKTNPGPGDISDTLPAEKANIAGITIKLESMAILVSAKATCVEVFNKLFSFLMYEP